MRTFEYLRHVSLKEFSGYMSSTSFSSEKEPG